MRRLIVRGPGLRGPEGPEGPIGPGSDVTSAQIAAARDAALAARNDAEAAAEAAEAVGNTNDTIIAGRINDPTSATAAALAPLDPAARAQARARATVIRSVGFIGDSITNNNGNNGSGFKNWLPLLTRGRTVRGFNISQGGVTVREWLTNFTATFNALPASQLPGRAVVMLGANDVGRAGYNVNASRTDLTELYDLLESRGVLPVASTILPRNDSAGANVVGYNTMVTALAAQRGYTLLPAYASIVNGSGGINAANLRDGGADPVHPDSEGYEVLSLGMVDTLRDTAPVERVTTAGPSILKRNLATNGLFATAGGKAGGIPDRSDYPLGWETNQSSNGAFVTDTQAEGRWYRFNAPTEITLHQGAIGNGTVIPGNRYRLSCLVRLAGTQVDDYPGGPYVRSIGVEFRNTDGGNPQLGLDTDMPNSMNLTRNLGGRVLQYVYQAVAPTGSGRVTLNVALPVGATLDLAEIELVDLTAQALG